MADLKSETKRVLDNFETTNTSQLISVLEQICNHLSSNLTQEYLQGKISKISQLSDGKEKTDLINSLKPYLEWYLQGASV